MIAEYRDRLLRFRLPYAAKGKGLLPWALAVLLLAGEEIECGVEGCSREPTDTDHDHWSGEVRDVLCHPHNIGRRTPAWGARS